MNFNELPSESFVTLVSLVKNALGKSPSDAQERINYQKRLNFLLDDLLSKSEQLQFTEVGTDIIESEKTQRSVAIEQNKPDETKENLIAELAEEYKIAFRNMQAQKASLETEIDKRLKKYKLFFIFGAVLYLLLNIICVKIFGWDTMEPITYLASVLFLVINAVIIVVSAKSIDPREYFNKKREKIQKEVYLAYDYQEERFQFLQSKVNEFK